MVCLDCLYLNSAIKMSSFIPSSNLSAVLLWELRLSHMSCSGAIIPPWEDGGGRQFAGMSNYTASLGRPGGGNIACLV